MLKCFVHDSFSSTCPKSLSFEMFTSSVYPSFSLNPEKMCTQNAAHNIKHFLRKCNRSRERLSGNLYLKQTYVPLIQPLSGIEELHSMAADFRIPLHHDFGCVIEK